MLKREIVLGVGIIFLILLVSQLVSGSSTQYSDCKKSDLTKCLKLVKNNNLCTDRYISLCERTFDSCDKNINVDNYCKKCDSSDLKKCKKLEKNGKICNDGNFNWCKKVYEDCDRDLDPEQCNTQDIECKKDSDCGFDEFIGNAFCKENNVFQNFMNYKCNNPGSLHSYCSSDTILKLKENCYNNQICSNGECVGVHNSCNRDSDCKTSEFCEFNSCNSLNGKCIEKPEICPAIYNPVCSCEGVTYSNDCVRASAGVSKKHDGACQNQQGECNRDSDCGTSGFIGMGFCQNDDLFQNFITYSCVSPGTSYSHCISSTIFKFKLNCGQSYCGDYSNNYCKTGNVYRSRNCYNKGCSNANCFSNIQVSEELVQTCPGECSNGKCISIVCSRDSDCGFNGFFGSVFCQDNNVFQNFINYKCNNPGSPDSFCSANTVLKLKEGCYNNQICSNGQCIQNNYGCYRDLDCGWNEKCIHGVCKEKTQVTCNKGYDCGMNRFIGNEFCKGDDVFQDYIVYNCNNPGTGYSSCSSNILSLKKEDCSERNMACSLGHCVVF